MPRLKVFQTTSGIHDHVVAAPSRPAALKAWGARTDLFSMGVASEVTDEKIKEKALEHPGKVIRISRSGGSEEVRLPKQKSIRRPMRPSRARLDEAEKRLAELKEKQKGELDAVEGKLRALERKRDELNKRHAKLRAAAEEKVERASDDYRAALDDWPDE
ncbi:MAG TPA: hypothetical protein VFT40_02235 [Sphingomicrobium sp.]|nr:hypothetical protein [Sphingomicrobium sp.]